MLAKERIVGATMVAAVFVISGLAYYFAAIVVSLAHDDNFAG